jgi:glycosyltransferase involved in cell wall biosynthesis
VIFHIPGLAHTQTNKDWLSCAYTQKVYKLCAMLHKLGHIVYHYGVEGSNPTCTENVVIMEEKSQKENYPENQDRTNQFRYDTSDAYTRCFNLIAAEEIMRRVKSDGEFLLCAWGWGHKPIADYLHSYVVPVESGIGYKDTWSRFRVFESEAWRHFVYGLGRLLKDGTREQNDMGNWYDTVIPNFFAPADFEYKERKENYVLYLGRIIESKGVRLAAEIAAATGTQLVVAGQGTPDGLDLRGAEFVGYADVDKRRSLMSGAKALLAPTQYVEPFGGVVVEAALSGTPVICPDWGGFTENVRHGHTGYRCRSFDEFCTAVENINAIDPKVCRAWGLLYSCDEIAPRYEAYFQFVLEHGAILPQKDWYSR